MFGQSFGGDIGDVFNTFWGGFGKHSFGQLLDHFGKMFGGQKPSEMLHQSYHF